MKKHMRILALLLVCIFLVSGLTVNASVSGVNETEDMGFSEFEKLDYQVIANTLTVSGRTPYGETNVTIRVTEDTETPRNLFVYQLKTDEAGDFAVRFIMNPEIYDENGENDATLRVGGENLNLMRIDGIPLYSKTEIEGCKNAFAGIGNGDEFAAFFNDYSIMLGVEAGYSEEEIEILYGYYEKNLPQGDESLEEIIEILSLLGDKLTRHKRLVEDVSLAAVSGDASEIRRLLNSANYADLIEENGLDFDTGIIIKEADLWARMLCEDGYETLEEIQEAFIAARDAQYAIDREFGGAVTNDREKNFLECWKVSNVANKITISGALDETVTTVVNIHVSGVESGVSHEAEKIISFLDVKATKPNPTADHVEFTASFLLNTARFNGEVTGSMRIGAENTNIHQFYITLYSQDEVDSLVEEFKDINSVDDLESFIENNKKMLEMTGNFSDKKLAVMYELYCEKDYDFIEDGETLANEVVSLDNATARTLDFLDALNNAAKSKRWGKVLEVMGTTYKELGDLSQKYGDVLELTEKAKKLKNVRGVYEKMLGLSFGTVQDVLDAFEEAYEAQKEEEKNTKPSGGGDGGGGPSISGSGGGSSSGMLIGEGVVAEEIVEIPEEILPSAPFSDISGYEWAESAIDALRQNGIIKGDGSGTFRPGDAMTREEYLSVLLKTFGVEIKSGTVPFGDVDSDAWYGDIVATAYEMGITKGMGDGRFGIGEKIIRADMVVLAARLAESLGINFEKKEAAVIFGDYAQIPRYAYENVVLFQQADLVNGDEKKNFNPMNNTTRAEAAVFFRNIYEMVKR